MPTPCHIRKMAARAKNRVDLECPDCGKTGILSVSEDDSLFVRDPRFSVDGITEGFTVSKKGQHLAETQVVCNDCKVAVLWP